MHIKHIVDEIIVLFLPVSSKLRIASIANSSVHLRLSRVTSSGKSSEKGLPIRLMVSERLVNVFGRSSVLRDPAHGADRTQACLFLHQEFQFIYLIFMSK